MQKPKIAMAILIGAICDLVLLLGTSVHSYIILLVAGGCTSGFFAGRKGWIAGGAVGAVVEFAFLLYFLLFVWGVFGGASYIPFSAVAVASVFGSIPIAAVAGWLGQRLRAVL